jgi:hypothetical protein
MNENFSGQGSTYCILPTKSNKLNVNVLLELNGQVDIKYNLCLTNITVSPKIQVYLNIEKT